LTEKYDVIVIGAGSGGIAFARRAREYGAKCVLIEASRLGGTCVNVGCVPKKVMWYAGSTAECLASATSYGFKFSKPSFSWQDLVEAREKYIAKLNSIYEKNLLTAGVELVTGKAKLVSPNEVEVGSRLLQADKICIATGGTPSVPAWDNVELGLNSDDFFALKELPKKVAVAGSGYIALELACALNELGSEVTLLARKDRLLRSFDHTLSDEITAALTNSGIKIQFNTEVTGLKQVEDKITLCTNSSSLTDYTHVIYAIGRKPNIAGLDLLKAGVAQNEDGTILVDNNQVTSCPNIYALGDVTGNVQLTPVAIAEGRALAERLYNQCETEFSLKYIPTVVFTQPPLATVGYSEHEVKDKFPTEKITIYQSKFNPLYYALSSHKVPTTVKLICLGDEELVVGCHICGLDAPEMLQGFAVAMQCGATKQDFDATLAIHPTSAEELVTMRNSR